MIASFGGASGTELGVACTSVSSLQAQYKRVIDQLNLTRIDLDIEGGAARRHRGQRPPQPGAGRPPAAVRGGRPDPRRRLHPAGQPDRAGVQRDQPAQQRQEPQPQRQPGQHHDDGLRPGHGHGRTPRSRPRTRCTPSSARSGTRKTSAQLWAMEGNTPMIGVNDTSSRGVHHRRTPRRWRASPPPTASSELAFWALGRDNQGQQRHAAEQLPVHQHLQGDHRRHHAAESPPPPVERHARSRLRRQVRRRRRGQLGQRHRDPALRPATAPTPSSWTAHRRHAAGARQVHGRHRAPAPRTAPRCSCTTATDRTRRSGPQGANGSLVNTGSGKCLDATGPSSANGTRLQIWTCAGSRQPDMVALRFVPR